MRDAIKVGVLTRDEFGLALFDTFLQERVVEARIRVCSPVKKANLKYWKCARQTIKNKTISGVAPLKDDRALFARFYVDFHTKCENPHIAIVQFSRLGRHFP